jgi:hypothetical protein
VAAAYQQQGEAGLVNKKPCARSHPKTAAPAIVAQALFQWHLADKGIRHVYIKARTPQLNGKVERSHHAEWETFNNYHRPHGALAARRLSSCATDYSGRGQCPTRDRCITA